MKIELQYSAVVNGQTTTVTETLGDDASSMPIKDFRPTAQISVQVERLTRSEKVSIFNRGNRQWDMSWTTTYTDTSEKDLMEFLLLHVKAATREGEIRVTLASNVDFVFNGVVTSVQPVLIKGLTAVVNYSVVAIDDDIYLET